MMPYGLKKTIGARRLHEHRIIAERALGRPLPDAAEVHHVDGDPSNNRNSNLVICQDAAYHALLHVRTRALLAGANPNTHKFCGKCGMAKPFASFYPRNDRAGGRSAQCRDCYAARYQRVKPTAKVNRIYKFASPEAKARVMALSASGLSQRQIARLVGARQCSVGALLKRERERVHQ